MTPEQQREQWLKRVLPGLVISVIYFVFISNIVSDKAKKAEEAYIKLMQRGISSAAMPGLQSQKNSLQNELVKLKTLDTETQNSLSEKAGFLYGKSNSNETVEQIADIFAQHHLRITEDAVLSDSKTGDLPSSIEDIRNWLHDSLQTEKTITLQQITFVGRYLDVYAMLSHLSKNGVKALPVFLTMTHLDGYGQENTGLKKWLLTLWI